MTTGRFRAALSAARPSLPAVVTLIAAALIVMIGGLQIARSRDVALENARNNARNLSRSLAQHAGRTIQGFDLVLSEIVERLERTTDRSDFTAYLARRETILDQSRNLVVTDADGSWQYQSSQRQTRYSSADRAYFAWHRDHTDREMRVDHPALSKHGDPILPVSRRIDKPDGSFAGVVVGAIDLDKIGDFYKTMKYGEKSVIGLWDKDGFLIVRVPTNPGVLTRNFANGRLIALARKTPSEAFIAKSIVDGIERIIAFDTVDQYPNLFVSASFAVDEILASWRHESWIQAIILGVAALALLGIGLVLELRSRHASAAALALAKSETRYRLLSDHSSDMIAEVGLDYRRLFVSPASRHLLGYEPEELTGTRPQDFAHPDDAPGFFAMIDTLTQGRAENGVSTHRLRHKDGRWIWVEGSWSLVRDQSGAPSGFVASVRSAETRRRVEDALRTSESLFRMLAENTGELIILGHDDGRRSYISPAATRLMGFTPDELAAMSLRDYVHPEDLQALYGTTRQLAAGSPEASVVYRARHRDGNWVWVEGIFRRVPDARGDEPTIVATFRDVSERKAQSEQLIEAKREAERARTVAEDANLAKTEFLASMSHEIRTPLNGILGYADILIADSVDLSPNDRRGVERIRNAGEALRTVVDDILDFSKIEAGQVDLDPHPFSVTVLIDDAMSIVQGLASKKSLGLTAAIDPAIGDMVMGDADRLRQILLNLLNNAIKFTPKGAVKLAVWRLAETEGLITLRFAVDDTGIGIPPEKRSRLFQRFSQVDGSIRREFGGTGLGLAISKALVEIMGGAIGIDDVPTGGSTFWFTVSLPIVPKTQKRADASTPAPVKARAAHVLLVEDQDINQEIARAVLEAAGHRVVVVGDGAKAVEAVRGTRFDLVLMDVQMPVMDGITSTRHIRGLAEHHDVPIVAMTANVMPAQVALLMRSGLDDHIGKPFRREELYAAVDRWAGRASPTPRGELIDQATFDEHVSS